MPNLKRKGTEQGSRSRSFGGCATCRSKHTKCDESRPTCTPCMKSGLSCGGYEKAIFFGSGDSASTDASRSRFRRPLFTEAERSCMSEALTARIAPSLASWHIDQIDQKCEQESRTYSFEVYQGPFGAFRLSEEHPTSSHDVPRGEVELEEINGALEVVPTNDDTIYSADLALTPRTRQLFQSVVDGTTYDSLPTDLDIWSLSNGSDRIEEIFDTYFPLDELQPQLGTSFRAGDLAISHPLITVDEVSQMSHTSNSESPEFLAIPRHIECSLPYDAVHLVKHYSTTVLKFLTPFRHSKTPWHVLFIPHAKNCLGALTLGEPMDHASLCAFYGMLSISAFSLSEVSEAHAWLESGQLYKQQAREHARHMLKTAYDVPKTAKYKSILMALLTMVQVAMISGDMEQTDCYLIEAEKFIRIKGLNRKKSRKVRLLHHCYAFERMFHESTFVAGQNSSHRRHIRNAIEMSGAVAHSQDSLTFRLGDWSNLEQEMAHIKGREEGENDLHLQLPGIWSDTLYPEIFGVPEVYVFLLSLIIRLREQKDLAEEQNTTNNLSLKDFLSRAKAVERSIKSLELYTPPQPDNVNNQSHASLQIILTAMQNALAIYFYRRIYDIDSSVLQVKVEAVRECLRRFELGGPDMAYGAARLIWPTFIAGCEAEEPNTRVAFAEWLGSFAASSGSRLFSETRTSLERVWSQRTTNSESVEMLSHGSTQ